MKLKYAMTPSHEGGAAVSGCGTIYIHEIKPTVDSLTKDLKIPFNLNDYLLGSTGMREYSGDIDIVFDSTFWSTGVSGLRDTLVEMYGEDNVAFNGNMVHLKYPITNFDASKNERLPRTGFVQIDICVGNADWEKFYHYTSPDSGYKGAHRNLAIAAIGAISGTVKSTELDSFDRPVSQIRWKWGPKGFFYIKRISKKSKDGTRYVKAQEDTVLYGPYYDGDDISRRLFACDYATSKDIESLENIIAAVHKYFDPNKQEEIWKRMAKNFGEWKDAKYFEYPPEIAVYFQPNDK